MDRELQDIRRQLNADPFNSDLILRYCNQSRRSQEPIEITSLSPLIQNYEPDDARAEDLFWSLVKLPQNIVLHDLTVEDIIDEIEDRALYYLQTRWGVDIYMPPVDTNPNVCYLGWLPRTNRLVTMFYTYREQYEEIRTLTFWYGIYGFDANNVLTLYEPWNPKNAPHEYPATLETIRNNHGEPIIHLYDRIIEVSGLASEALEEFSDAEAEQEAAAAQELYDDIREDADELINAYTCEQLEEMPTQSTGQFSNLKLEFPLGAPFTHIRLWYSRMTILDGAPFDYAVEIEIWNPIEGRWENYATYPCQPELQSPDNVIYD